MKQKVLLLLVVLIATLFANSDFLQPQPTGYDWAFQEDHRNVLAGYHKVHSFADTLPWLTGFIDEAHPSFRPISSYMFYGMVWYGEHYGYKPLAWVTAGLFAACCYLMALLAWRLSRSYPVALATGVLCTLAASWLPTMRTDNGIPFDWFYLSDNTAMIIPLLASLIAFLLWRESGKRWHLAASYGAFVLACLTKEQAYIMPLLVAALCFVPSPEYSVTLRHALRHSAYMVCISVAFFMFRAVVVQGAHNPPNRGEALLNALRDGADKLPPSPYQVIMIMQPMEALQAAVGYAAAFGALYVMWRHWDATRAILARCEVRSVLVAAGVLWLCALLAYIPALGFDIAGHRGLLSVFFKVSAVATLGQAAWLVAHQVVQGWDFRIGKFPVVDCGRRNDAA